MRAKLSIIADAENFPLERPGVYVIENVVTGECYVGLSRNVKRRITDHLYGRGNRRLFDSIRQFGPSNFRAIPVCYSLDSEIDHLLPVEADFISALRCVLSGFNVAEAGPGLGRYGPAYCDIIREALTLPKNRARLLENAQDPLLRRKRGEAIRSAFAAPDRPKELSEAKKTALSALHSNKEVQSRRIASTKVANRGEERNKKISSFAASSMWITNGISAKRVDASSAVPDGWTMGRAVKRQSFDPTG